jgi:hypothetical protein
MPKQTKKNVDSISVAVKPCPFLEKLPDEMLLAIFKHVEAEARPNLVRSCRRFHRLRHEIYTEHVKTETGQEIKLCNCPFCKKILTIPLVFSASRITKKRHRSKIITRPMYRGKIYCSCACVMEQHIRDV